MFHRLQIICIILPSLLAGCMTLPAKAPPENKVISWGERQKQLRSIASWALKGAIGVKQQQKGFTAQVNWQHQPSNYHIRLFGPLGSGQVQLDGTSSQVTLIDADKKRISAESADQLLKQETGWELPISNLKYWIRGLPAPGSAAKKQLDVFQHLQELQQQGWHIKFQRYTQVKGIDLPSKMTLMRNDLRIRIIIKHWAI